MTNKELQEFLKGHPDDMPIKFIPDPDFQTLKANNLPTVYDFNEDAILLTSETAFVNKDAPEEEWDTEDGKIELGDGKQYLLFNPIIV